MFKTSRLTALALVLVLSAASQATAKQAMVEIKTSVKGFISSCQSAGGTSSGGNGAISCQAGDKNTSCSVSNGRTDVCVQSTPGRRLPERSGENTSGGNHSSADKNSR